MPAPFARFDRLSEDLATARHNWREHTLALVLLAAGPTVTDETVADAPRHPLQHSMMRAGRATSVMIEDATFKASEATIGPFSAAAVVNATTGAPIGFVDIGKPVTLEPGASFVFRFPGDVLSVAS